MNGAAALRVLVTGGYRFPEINDDMRERWDEELNGFEPWAVLRAAKEWSGGAEKFPTLNEFRGQVLSVMRRNPKERSKLTEYAGEGMRVGSIEERKANLAKLRTLIAEQDGPLFKRDDGSTVDPMRPAK